MNLDEKCTKELLELHNALAEVSAGPKTFSTKAKLVARIRSLAESKRIDLASYVLQGRLDSALSKQATGVPSDTDAAKEPKEPKKRSLGIGELARMLLMDPIGLPHSLIAAMVNAQIPGAAASDKSVRWYASKMRKEGFDVPPRGKHFPSEMDEKQSKEWLATVKVVRQPDAS